MTAEEILVIILASALAVLLILSIIAVVKVLQIINKVKKISDHLERMTDKAQTIADLIKNAAGPFAIGKTLGKMARSAKKKSKKE